MTGPLPSWTHVALPHDDIRDEQSVRAEYAVNLGKVDREDKHVPKQYTDPTLFFQTTFLTEDLRRLLTDALDALSGKKTDRVIQLRTPFGGGKSHTLVALWHLAKHRDLLAALPEVKSLPDPGPTRVAVLPCADLTPGIPRKVKGGIELRTLWGELAWRLGGAEAYAQLKAIDQSMTAPGGEVIEALLRDAQGRATLLLADEVLVYVEKAHSLPVGSSNLGRQTLSFLQALTESVAGDPRSALVYSLQASVGEALGAEGLLQILDKLVARVDARRVPVQDRQVREIVRRRLFKSLGEESARKNVAAAYGEQYRRLLLSTSETEPEKRRAEEEAKAFEEEILESYPFHPALIRLMYERWGSLPSYQRTRGALQFLGTVVHVLFKRGHAGALIGPGDVPLDDPDVRSEFFRQVGEREKWDTVLDADIAGERSRAKRVDRQIGEDSPSLLQKRVGSRVATSICLYSFGTRKDELRGIPRGELVAASVEPTVEEPAIARALGELREALLYLHSTGGRFRFDTIPSLTKLIEEATASVDSEDALKRVRATLAAQLPESPSCILWPESAARIPDERREFQLVWMPLDWAERTLEQNEAEARALVQSRAEGDRGGKRKFKNALGFVIPAKAQADNVRSLARKVIGLEALKRKAKSKAVQIDSEQHGDLDDRSSSAARELETACRSLYGEVLLPVRAKDASTDPIAFRRVEIGSLASAARGDVNAKVFELLARNYVYPSITTERFLELLGVASRPFIPFGEALDEFFSFLDRPKLRTDTPLYQAVAEAVASRKLGYVPAAQVHGDNLRLDPGTKVRFGTRHEPDEFLAEEGAFLVSPGLAEQLAPPQKPSPAALPRPPEETVTSGAHPDTEAEPAGKSLPPPAPKGAKATRYDLQGSVQSVMQWYDLAKAVQLLAGGSAKEEGSFVVRLEVTAKQPGGFKSETRNVVEEILREKNLQAKGVASE
jgi:hypothetical protein